MKNLNNYITEAWSGVKKQSYEQEIKSWCEEMGIKNYTINSKGEIDVDGKVDLGRKAFGELPYKFGTVNGYFSLGSCKNLTSLKNCPDHVIGGSFNCSYCEKLDSLEGCPKKVEGNFACDRCKNLDSLEGCPKEVGNEFWCAHCKREFTEEEVKSLCKVKKSIYL